MPLLYRRSALMCFLTIAFCAPPAATSIPPTPTLSQTFEKGSLPLAFPAIQGRAPIPSFPSAPPSFKALEVTPGKATIVNRCGYTVYLESVPSGGCPTPITSADIGPGESWSEMAADCSIGNTSLKVYRTKGGKPMQFEYGKSGGSIWYNLSFIDCLQGDDLSPCAGHEGGLQIGGSGNCYKFWCNPGESCCDKGYCDAPGTAARIAYGNEPVIGCYPGNGILDAGHGLDLAALGVTIELCAISGSGKV